MIGSAPYDDEAMLQAYCDDALDPASAMEFERRIDADSALRKKRDQIMSLRRAIRALPQDDLPPQLLNRVTSAVSAKHSPRIGASWRTIAASALIGAVLASSAMFAIDRNNAQQDLARQVTASHIRSLLAPQPFDVASSDRHTVKPWFTTRIPESPQVADLTSQGFVLAGGRIDVIGRDPVATIVYRHAAHTISLTTLRVHQTVTTNAISGYNVISWKDADFSYVAVSDLPREDLETFERDFKSALLRQ